LYVNDAGSLTVTGNSKHVANRILFVNECEDIREEVLNSEIGFGEGTGVPGGKLDYRLSA
jgi:hypothetical protein